MNLLNSMSYRSEYSRYFTFVTFITDAPAYIKFLDDCYFAPVKVLFFSIVYYDLLSIMITLGVIGGLSFLIIKKIYL